MRESDLDPGPNQLWLPPKPKAGLRVPMGGGQPMGGGPPTLKMEANSSYGGHLPSATSPPSLSNATSSPSLSSGFQHKPTPKRRERPPNLEASAAKFDTKEKAAILAIDETAIPLHPPLPLVGVSIAMERGRQQNDSLVNG